VNAPAVIEITTDDSREERSAAGLGTDARRCHGLSNRSVPGGIFVEFPRPTAWRCASPPNYPQHDVSFAADVAGSGAEQQPHPAPPVDFTSASRAQQASVPVGAGPPQHPGTASFFWVARASGPGASGVVIWV
jgi:hypothetical protein